MSDVLQISQSLSLPIEAVTQRIAFMGAPGSGKTYAAQKLAELMMQAGAQIVAFDPVGNWYALRVARGGSRAAFPITIFGGLNGDIPIEPLAGGIIAEQIVNRGLSAVLDVSQFEDEMDMFRFVSDFARRFFFLKKSNPSAIHILIEEAQEFLPEKPANKFQNEAFHHMRRLDKIGRNYGIGVTLASQRPQAIAKEVLNLTQWMFALQTGGPHEREAIQSWVRDRVGEIDVRKLLPGLDIGHALVFAPRVLEEPVEVKIAAKHTLDASSAPQVGETRSAIVKPLNESEMRMLREAMAATITRLKETDPEELKETIKAREDRINELEKALLDASNRPSYESAESRTEWRTEEVQPLIEKLASVQEKAMEAAILLEEADERITNAHALFAEIQAEECLTVSAPSRAPCPGQSRSSGAPPPADIFSNAGNRGAKPHGGLSAMRRKFLTALAQHPSGLSKDRILLFADYRSSGDTSSEFAALAREGLVAWDGRNGKITDAGIAMLGTFERLPTGSALRRMLIGGSAGTLTKFERAAVNALASGPVAMRDGLTKSQILEATGYRSSGDTSSSFAKLKRYGYVTARGNILILSKELL